MDIKSRFTLSFHDDTILTEYIMLKRSLMTSISCLILLCRFIFTVSILISFLTNDHITLRRMLTYIGGTLLHLVWLIFYYKFPR
jgi:hypothetical protein